MLNPNPHPMRVSREAMASIREALTELGERATVSKIKERAVAIMLQRTPRGLWQPIRAEITRLLNWEMEERENQITADDDSHEEGGLQSEDGIAIGLLFAMEGGILIIAFLVWVLNV